MLFYLGTLTPLAPALIALVATCDQSHHVAIQPATDGVKVVLRHDCPISPAHHHGIAARLLTIVAQRTTAAQPDHVIQFRSAETERETPVRMAESAPESPPPVVPFPCPDSIHLVWRANPFPLPSRSPPDAGDPLLALRTTVLVI